MHLTNKRTTMKKVTTVVIAMMMSLVLSPILVQGRRVAFVPSSRAKIGTLRTPSAVISQPPVDANIIYKPREKTTSLQMGYRLPPGDPKGPLEQIEAIIPTVVTGVLVLLFFASPLGGIFFAFFNSIFVLAILTPFILYGGFQIWSALVSVCNVLSFC